MQVKLTRVIDEEVSNSISKKYYEAEAIKILMTEGVTDGNAFMFDKLIKVKADLVKLMDAMVYGIFGSLSKSFDYSYEMDFVNHRIIFTTAQETVEQMKLIAEYNFEYYYG